MKKIIALILVIVMLVGMTGCGKSDSAKTTTVYINLFDGNIKKVEAESIMHYTNHIKITCIDGTEYVTGYANILVVSEVNE